MQHYSHYSVVIPAHNAARTIRQTLESVVNQTVKPAQVLVVDDGSTDETVVIARGVSPLINVLTQVNQGPAAACSLGLANAYSPIIGTVDADDLWHPEKMARQLTVLQSDPSVHLVYCLQRQFTHGQSHQGSGEVRSGLNRSGIVFRRQVYEQVGDMIDQAGQRGDVVDWLARVRQAGFVFMELTRFCRTDDSLRAACPGSVLPRRTSATWRSHMPRCFATGHSQNPQCPQNLLFPKNLQPVPTRSDRAARH